MPDHVHEALCETVNGASVGFSAKHPLEHASVLIGEVRRISCHEARCPLRGPGTDLLLRDEPWLLWAKGLRYPLRHQSVGPRIALSANLVGDRHPVVAPSGPALTDVLLVGAKLGWARGILRRGRAATSAYVALNGPYIEFQTPCDIDLHPPFLVQIHRGLVAAEAVLVTRSLYRQASWVETLYIRCPN